MKKIYFLIIAILLINFTNAQWTQIGQDIDGEMADDRSGYSVSLSSDGSIVAIGARENNGNGTWSGHVRVYENQSGAWIQIGQDINGEAADDFSGSSVSLTSDGSILAIGAPYNDGSNTNAGHVRIYENLSGTWTQIGQDIDGEAANDWFGSSVSLNSDGSVVAVGAIYHDGYGSNAGHVRVYQNQSGTWSQIGLDIDGEATGDNFGTSVSISSDGSIIAIGAPRHSGNGSLAGRVRIYENQSGSWIQIGQDIDGEAAFNRAGTSVSISSDGSIVAIGANYNDGNSTEAGHVRVYENQSGTWTQIGQDIDGEAAYDWSGLSVSISSDGSIVAIGAHKNNGNGTVAGHVRIYKNQSGTWTQIGQDIDGEATYDASGYSVSLSSNGSNVAIGAYQNDGNGSNSGHVRVYGNPNVSINENINNTELSIYPNPTTGIITVEADDIESIEVINIQGELVLSKKTKDKNQKCELDLSTQAKGIYIIKVRTNKGVAVQKIVLE